ncbi:MAG: hypothetical protein ABJK28_14260 [Algibacter sp.]
MTVKKVAPKIKLPITHYLVLGIKSWKKELPNTWRNLIIAEALNYCVCHEDLIIKGYLLAQKKIYLIAINESHSMENVLTIFSKQVAKGIYEYERRRANNYEAPLVSKIFDDLFIKHPLYNQYIIKLITGEKIMSPYYNPYVVWLENKIRNYNYCSAIDYSGAKGPVLVQTH